MSVDKSPEVLAEAARKGVVWNTAARAWLSSFSSPRIGPMVAPRMFASGWMATTSASTSVHPTELAALQALPDPVPSLSPGGSTPADGVGLGDAVEARATLAAALAGRDTASWTLPQLAAEVVRRLTASRSSWEAAMVARDEARAEATLLRDGIRAALGAEEGVDLVEGVRGLADRARLLGEVESALDATHLGADVLARAKSAAEAQWRLTKVRYELGFAPGANAVEAAREIRAEIEGLRAERDRLRATLGAPSDVDLCDEAERLLGERNEVRSELTEAHAALSGLAPETEPIGTSSDEEAPMPLGERLRWFRAERNRAFAALEDQRNAARKEADERHARAVRLADELREARARIATIEGAAKVVVEGLSEDYSNQRIETARLRARVAELEAAQPEAPALTEAEIAARCGLERCDDSADGWRRGGMAAVYRFAGQWSADTMHDTERAALLAYARARGVDLGDAPTQPAPSGGTGDCAQELLDALDPQDPIRPALEARRALGDQRYGVPLGRGDGRDAERDLREELLDAAIYAQRLHLTGLARMLLHTATDLAIDWKYRDEPPGDAQPGWSPRERATLVALLDALEEADASMAIALRTLCGLTPTTHPEAP